jgi:hypothetical protein
MATDPTVQAANAFAGGLRGSCAALAPLVRKTVEDINRAFGVPAALLGDPPVPRSRLERGQQLVATARAAGVPPWTIHDQDVELALAEETRRFYRRYGITPA